tara:strand:+ start:850 stop:1188 length:339 start_codon:yes stop_codon:yes gene_type:complete
MAFTAYHNIIGSSSVTTELLAPGDTRGDIATITLTNKHATNDATVSLFIQKLSADSTASSSYYILSTLAIPSDTSLLLDNPNMLSFDNSVRGFGLYITVGSTDTLDVLIGLQ